YFDTTAPEKVASYYKVTAVDGSGNESAAAVGNAVRPSSDVTAPAAPSGITTTPTVAGIALNWADNSEPDLAGYNIYRSNAQFGTFVKLNAGGLLASSDYNDTAAPASTTSYYRITAVDSNGNESVAGTISAVRPADTTPPATPT